MRGSVPQSAFAPPSRATRDHFAISLRMNAAGVFAGAAREERRGGERAECEHTVTSLETGGLSMAPVCGLLYSPFARKAMYRV